MLLMFLLMLALIGFAGSLVDHALGLARGTSGAIASAAILFAVLAFFVWRTFSVRTRIHDPQSDLGIQPPPSPDASHGITTSEQIIDPQDVRAFAEYWKEHHG